MHSHSVTPSGRWTHVPPFLHLPMQSSTHVAPRGDTPPSETCRNPLAHAHPPVHVFSPSSPTHAPKLQLASVEHVDPMRARCMSSVAHVPSPSSMFRHLVTFWDIPTSWLLQSRSVRHTSPDGM